MRMESPLYRFVFRLSNEHAWDKCANMQCPFQGASFFMGQHPRIAAEPSGRPMTDWINTVPNDGLIRYTSMFNADRLLLTSPKALAEVLTNQSYNFVKPERVRLSIGRILGVGILLAEGEEHKMQRKNLLPAFAFRHVKDLYPVFWGKSKEAVQAMTESICAEARKMDSLSAEQQKTNGDKSDLINEADNGAKDTAVIEVGGWASRATLDIIGVAGLGQSFGAIADPTNILYTTYRTVFSPSRQAQVLGMLGLFLPVWLLTRLPIKRNGEIEAAALVIRSVCRKSIRAKKEKMEKGKLTDVDILSVAMESGGFSEENLIDQLMTFLAAGHETTASAMTWAIYMLCLHPDVQTRLREEVRSNLPSPDSDEPVTSATVDRMPYLNAVCNEVLRYYSPVPITLRDTAETTTILGTTVPRGTKIMLSPAAINKDTHYWGPDAQTFNPDRWLPGPGKPNAATGGAQSNYSNMTFLHGPRSCIGQAFAKAEFACLLAAWSGRLAFELRDKEEMDEEKMVIKGGITARPAKGLHVHATVVQGW